MKPKIPKTPKERATTTLQTYLKRPCSFHRLAFDVAADDYQLSISRETVDTTQETLK